MITAGTVLPDQVSRLKFTSQPQAREHFMVLCCHRLADSSQGTLTLLFQNPANKLFSSPGCGGIGFLGESTEHPYRAGRRNRSGVRIMKASEKCDDYIEDQTLD